MLNIMMMCINEREQQILKTAFEQMQFKPMMAQPNYGNYVKVVQFLPDVLLIEMPHLNSEQQTFMEMIKKHKKARNIPIICYGDPLDKAIVRGFTKKGADDYIERPLKFSNIIKIITLRLKQRNKNVEIAADTTKSEKDDDIEKILDTNTLRTQKITLMVKHISKLMAFPFTVAKVLQLADSEKTGASDLAKILEADPVIAASILKVSNTVFFASANRRISSIKDAIVRIGFRETKRITMGMSVMDLFGSNKSTFGFNRYHYWFHCLGTAIIAEAVAKRLGDLNAEEAFLAGLLHDFGIILLDEFYPSIFSKILEATANSGAHFVDKELEILEITHNDVVAELFGSWKLPESITESIYNHYTICDSGGNLDTPGKKLAMCIAMGNVLSKSMSLGSACDQYVFPLPKWIFEKIKLTQGFSSSFEEDVTRDVKLFCKFLKIDESELADRDNCLLGDRKLSVGVMNLAGDSSIPAEVYLRSQGHSAAKIPLSESYLECNTKFDLIVVWAGEDTTPEQLVPLQRIVMKPADDGTVELVPRAAPVLALVPCKSPLAGRTEFSKMSFMQNCYDQRQLDINILAVIEGRRVLAVE